MPKLTSAHLPGVLLVLAGVVAALALFSTARAKGPFEARISGGSLPGEVTIPLSETQHIPAGIFFGNGRYLGAPAPSPTNGYNIKLYGAKGEGDVSATPFLVTSLTYYAPDSSRPALVRDGRGFYKADPVLQSLLDRYISAAPRQLPEAGGRSSGDAALPLWYIAPCLALAAAFVSGVAGRRLLMRRMRD